MDIFKHRITEVISAKWLTFQWMDQDTVINKLLSSAEEYVITTIASELLSKEDRDLFRDAYLSAPDIFDADEFLSERVNDYDKEVDKYFDKWLEKFTQSL